MPVGTVQRPHSFAHFSVVVVVGAGAGAGAGSEVVLHAAGTRVEAVVVTVGEDFVPDQDIRAPSPMPIFAKARQTRQSSALPPAASRPSRMSRKVGLGWVWFSPSMTRPRTVSSDLPSARNCSRSAHMAAP